MLNLAVQAQDTTEWTQELKKRAARIERRAAALKHKRSPWEIRDYAARRLILKADWEKYVKTQKDSGLDIDEAEVYTPIPATWEKWYRTAKRIEALAKTTRLPLTFEEMAAWNLESVKGTVPDSIKVGAKKTGANYGANTKRADALSFQDVAALAEFRFDFLEPYARQRGNFATASKGASQHNHEPRIYGREFLKWTPLVCEEQLPKKIDLMQSEECRRLRSNLEFQVKSGGPNHKFAEESLRDMDKGLLKKQASLHAWYWTSCWPRLSESAARKFPQCGFIEYLDPKSAQTAFKLLVRGMESFAEAGSPNAFFFALRAQRAVAAIHPFPKGNGRVSRWVMDFITYRAGLPPLIIHDHNRDLSTPETTYFRETFRETMQAYDRVEACLKRYEAKEAGLENSECGYAELTLSD